MQVAIIGGGAAGFFAALSCKKHHPDAQVTIFEKTSKLLAKVKVSGGGRCNVTHACQHVSQLAKNYPRGERFLKKAFSQFAVADTIQWFQDRGVRLKTEQDGRMFPTSDDSQTIIDCFMREAARLQVQINTGQSINHLEVTDANFLINGLIKADKVIITTGGSPKREGLVWLEHLGHHIEHPVPSLFTFNMPGEAITALMGLSVANATVKVQGSKLNYSGPLLITHWGMSGPAILKTSAWGARHLSERAYTFEVGINWTGSHTEQQVRDELGERLTGHPKKKVTNQTMFQLPARLWEYLLQRAGLRLDITGGEVGSKSLNRLTNTLYNDVYEVKGKTTFKEEFVTCGGISLADIHPKTMESKVIPGLYFAGEVMDIDGITGGFNFQAAWTTGYIAGKLNSQE